jgi:pimeloyl-ACP methyl ester carboxylesterase
MTTLFVFFNVMSELILRKEPFNLRNRTGNTIRGETRFADNADKRTVVVICHSFMAFKEWGFFPLVAEQIARAGYTTVTFNFSYNGVVGDGKRITDFQKFEQNTFSYEYDDLGDILDAIVGGNLPGALNVKQIVVLGHSRGAGVAIIRASRDKRIDSLISWSPVASFDRWTARQKEHWRTDGFLPLSRDAHVSPLRLGIQLLDDLVANSAKFDIVSAASNIRIPWLILHGKTDVIVPVREAEDLYRASNQHAELVLLDSVGHLYGTPATYHVSMELQQVLNTTIHWLQQHI